MAFDLTFADKDRPVALVIDGKWHHMGFMRDGVAQTRFPIPHQDALVVLAMLGSVVWTPASAAADKARQPQPEAPTFFRLQRYRPASLGAPQDPGWVREGDWYINSTDDVGPIFLRARSATRVVWGYVYHAALTTFDDQLYGIDYKIETSATPGEAAPPVTLSNRVLKGGITQ